MDRWKGNETNMNKYLTYRYALSLTSQFYFCGVPFRFDTAPKCTLNCSYCFAMSRGGRRTSNTLLVDFDKIERKLSTIFEKGEAINDVTGEMLTRKVPIHFGGLSDPFSNGVTSALSKKLLELFNKYEYPIIISTKNTGELLKEDTFSLLRKIKYLAVQISITTSERKLSTKLEPNVPPPDVRVKCIEMLSKEGIHCICRLQPLLFPEINRVTCDLIPMLSEAKCKHVIIEYLKLPVERNISLFNTMLRNIGWDAYEFYKNNGARLVGREWLLPSNFKWQNLRPIIDNIHRWGMTYGAGDYGLHHLGDTHCCCGTSKLDGFSNWFQGNFGNIIRNSQSNFVKFAEVEKHWFPQKSVRMVLNSNCRLNARNGSRLLDYLKIKWNTPGSANAPDAFLGVVWDGDHDKEGNCMYLKEKICP